MTHIVCGSIGSSELVINTKELSRRLETPEALKNDTVELCMDRIVNSIRPRYCYAKTSVLLKDNMEIVTDFCTLRSKSLSLSLKCCEEAIVMAVTLGLEADRLINAMGAMSPARGFVADGISSALAEAAADYVSDIINKDFSVRPRYSPGYGDLTLECQRPLLDYLNADKLLGIKLGDSLLMTPHKTITAICGLERK